MNITSSTGVLSVAPVGTDPMDASAFVNIGHLLDGVSFESTLDPDPVDMRQTMREALDKTRKIVLEAEYQSPFRNVVEPFFGIDVVEHPAVPERSLIFDRAGWTIYAPRTETRPFTDLEREGEWAKRTVRHGLTKALPWLNMDPGPEPDDAYTDHLFHVSMLASLGLAGVDVL